ncbi:retrovirus-related pol polyprotein from transposon TNT 1-94 [Tanacetum coccineum]
MRDGSPRQWYKRFDKYILSNGFKRSSYDSYIYYRSYAPDKYIYLLLYVDDMMITCKSKAEIGSTKSLLKKEFDIKELEEAKKFLIPLGGHFKLSLKDCSVRDYDVERMSKVPYANKVGSLMYLMVCTRSDIAYAVSVVSIYLANPGKNHWEAVKWILKYL